MLRACMAGGSILWYLRSLAAARQDCDTADGELLERFALRRDATAFEVLLTRHGPMVWGVCRNLLCDPHAAEDAFQATFLILVRKSHSIRRGEQLGNWLYGVAHRVSLRSRNQAYRRQARERTGHAADVSGSPHDFDADTSHILYEELSRLPERYRAPLILCCLEGKSREEAARDLGWSPGSVRGRLERGRERLRQQLQRRGVALSAIGVAAVSPAAVPTGLLAATARIALQLHVGASSAGIPFTVLSLTEGTLKAMMLHKLKLFAAGALALGILTAGANTLLHSGAGADQPVVGKAEPQKSPAAKEREQKLQAFLSGANQDLPTWAFLTEVEVNALLTAYKGRARTKTLLKEQLDAAREEAEARRREFLAGRGTLDIVLAASVRLLQSELELCHTQADRLNSLEVHLQRMTVFAKENQQRFDAGRIPIMDFAESKFFQARASLWLERAKAGETVVPLGWWDVIESRQPAKSKQP